MIQLLNLPCALVDLETTGASTGADRITEVGLLRCRADTAPQSWEQLLNPGTGIPEFIQQLTGITPLMVADKPAFEQVANELWLQLQDCLFVAHNARFDYGFLKAAFRRCGYDFKPKIVCTLKLARELFPDWPRHGLDAICQQIGYPRSQSHRAMADVQAMFAFLCFAIAQCGQQAVDAAAAKQLRRPALPPHIDPAELEVIPNTPGVYYFYGEQDSLLYVGKSKTLRTRILSHFNADHSSGKEMALSQSVRRIDFRQTVGELGALLLENEQIKSLSPIYNRRQRRYQSLWVWELLPGANSALQPQLHNRPAQGWLPERDLYGPYRNRGSARNALNALIRERQLCNRVLGLESGNGACFARQLGQCHGACEGVESIDQHNQRLLEAFNAKKLAAWPYPGPIAIREQSPDRSQSCLHIICHWAYLGTAADTTAALALLQQAPTEVMFDVESYRLLYKAIHKGQHEVIELAPSMGSQVKDQGAD
ncbi:exonuclease domain-containing protein [Pseudomaricurvus sp. HS19]|uniref:exonuclease domain-containing protein n=1 Tax=Pseudomaricurvus sp. HS19 TaxID=2692626 RepID=UPI0013721A0B|nr:exonuclease domain-containing protein [Pseudomaricurvus sp. HS19]MYM62607.1 GIY-YIG nuclease family protein [Pseudomaricurvus sp. HS19]